MAVSAKAVAQIALSLRLQRVDSEALSITNTLFEDAPSFRRYRASGGTYVTSVLWYLLPTKVWKFLP